LAVAPTAAAQALAAMNSRLFNFTLFLSLYELIQLLVQDGPARQYHSLKESCTTDWDKLHLEPISLPATILRTTNSIYLAASDIA
jgi:hypothetical protein